MAQMQKTRVSVERKSWSEYQGDLLAVGLFKDAKTLPRELARLDEMTGGVAGNLLKIGDFAGKTNETALVYTKKAKFPRVLLVGLGERNKLKINNLRQAAGVAARIADRLGATRVGLALHLPVEKLDPRQVGQAITEGTIVGRYDYRDFLPEKENGKSTPKMEIAILEPDGDAARDLSKGNKSGLILAEAQNRARQLSNTPGNIINPPVLAREAQRLARQFGLKCKIFDDKQLQRMGMNTILAVGSGSASKPRLIMLEHPGRRKGGNPDVVLVGKAITFDTGGISIKPSQNMETMKYDKSGGCDVIAALTAAAELKLPLRVVGLIPTAENMPSGTSYRPGDIIRTFSGKTVEINNTDAEGRLILCNALAYAARMKPGAILDIATLTGAMRVALGEAYAGVFTNKPELQAQVIEAAQRAGEPLWPMPIGPEYLENMKSAMADLKNTGPRDGGSCNAAAFLQEFIKPTPWVHIDIAAVGETDKGRPWFGKGATGFGVRLMVEFLREYR